jgi:FKBP-type peptidyl-prolyl cis-trans isomerase
MQRFRRVSASFLPVAIALILTAGCARDATESSASTQAPALDTPRARVSYMVGLDMAKTMAPVKDEVDIEIAIAAIRAVHAGQKPALDEAAANQVREQFTETLRKKHELKVRELARTNLAAAERFLADNAKAGGVTTTASGLQYKVLRSATGPKPTATDTVRVHFSSTNLAGQRIESTYATDHPAVIALNRVFPGWSEGVQLMPVGSKVRFWIPPALAYGERGVAAGLGAEIEPNALLIFDVELLEIAKASPTATGAGGADAHGHAAGDGH